MSLDNIVEAEGVIFSSDWHNNQRQRLNTFQAANDGNYAVGFNGDEIGDYSLQLIGNQLGYQMPEQHLMSYLQRNLDEQDFSDYITVTQLQQYGGIDNLLSLVSESDRAQARLEIEASIQRAQKDKNLAKRVQDASQKFNVEMRDQVLEDVIKYNALYQVMIDEEAKSFATTMNQFSNVTVLYNLGNHEPSFFVDQVRQYLDNPNQIVDLSTMEGYASIVNSDGEEMTLAGTTNCAQVMPYLQQIMLDEKMYEIITAHMAPDGEYTRMNKGESARELDVFMTHGQVGKPKFSDGREGYDVPYLEDAKRQSLEAKLTVEGHIHSEYEGKNEFGANMVRAAGSRAVIVKKENGELRTSWVTVDDQFDGNHNNPLPYSMEYLEKRVQEVAQIYKQQLEELPLAA